MRTLFSIILIVLTLFIFGCTSEKSKNVMHFAVSAEYPPFEYIEQNELKGFDIDLANLIAKHLGKQAVFDNMQFSTILPALSLGQVDAAISTITITPARQQHFDFTAPYYFETMAAVFRKNKPVHSKAALKGKIIACQLGSTMEIWLRKTIPDAFIVAMDNNTQAIEAVKAGHADLVLMDGPQGAIFSQKNSSLGYSIIAQSRDGYGIVLPKNSPLKAKINRILNTLKAQGEIEKLKQKWLAGA